MKSVIQAGLLVLLGMTGSLAAEVPDMVRSHEAIQYNRQYAMVCGVIASTHHARRARGAPVYLNFDKPYPDADFTALIWGEDRENFEVDFDELEGYKACVYGRIELHKGKAQIIIKQPEQFNYRAPDPAAVQGATEDSEQQSSGTTDDSQ